MNNRHQDNKFLYKILIFFSKYFMSYYPKKVQRNIFRQRFNSKLHFENNITISIAKTSDEIEEAFKLLYQIDMKNNLLSPNRRKVKVTKHHVLPTSQVIIIKKDKRIIATMSFFPDSGLGLPLESDWDIKKIRQSSSSLCEITSLSIIQEEIKNADQYIMMSFIFLGRLLENILSIKTIIISTESKRVPLFKQLFGFKVIQNEKDESEYSNNEQTVGLYLNIEHLQKYLKINYNDRDQNKSIYHAYTKKNYEQNLLFSWRNFWDGVGKVYTPEEFNNFFFGVADFNNNISDYEKNLINSYYSSFLHKNFIDYESEILTELRIRHRFLCNMTGKIIFPDLVFIKIKILDSSINGLGFIVEDDNQQLKKDDLLSISIDLSPHEKVIINGSINFKKDNKIGFIIKERPQRWQDFITYLENKYSGKDILRLIKNSA